MMTTDVKKEPPCPKCGGRGSIIQDNLREKKCGCMRVQDLKRHLGRLWRAPVFRSELFQPGGGVDRTDENLFLSAPWEAIAAHLKWVLGCKYNIDPNHKYLLTTDERLLRVYLGGDAYLQKSKKDRDEIDTYNNLRDFILKYDLVVIRLGLLGYPNKAMPGTLKEALGIREFEGKPTWLVDQPSYPFGPDHLSWSPDLDDYIKDAFDVVGLPSEGILKSETQAPSPVLDVTPTYEIVSDEEGDYGMGAEQSGPPSPYKRPQPTSSMKPYKDSEFGTGGRTGNFKPGGGKSAWKKKSSNNPMGD